MGSQGLDPHMGLSLVLFGWAGCFCPTLAWLEVATTVCLDAHPGFRGCYINHCPSASPLPTRSCKTHPCRAGKLSKFVGGHRNTSPAPKKGRRKSSFAGGTWSDRDRLLFGNTNGYDI